MSMEEEASSNILVSTQNRVVVPATSTALTPSTTAVPPPEAAPPTSAATPVAPPPSAKSWASLLRPSTSSASASASAGPSRNALPTASVMGISIPAASVTTQDATLHVSPSRRTELVRLLTSRPGAGHPTIATAISYAGSAAASTTITTTNLTPSTINRPGGLINSGNMCFANSVLRITVYCPPFHQLFVELGRVLGGAGPGLGVSSGMNGINGVGETSGSGTAAEASAYSLVEATVEFLSSLLWMMIGRRT